jgi:hypothetical protein
MTFDAAERIADAVLYEGYVLYPYRASAAKNRFRWQFGVVAPRPPREDGEPWFAQAECVIDPRGSTPTVAIRVRYLRPQVTESSRAASPSWLEGVPHAIDLDPASLGSLRAGRQFPLDGAGIDARVTVLAEDTQGLVKLRLRLENLEPWQPAFEVDRDTMLQRSLVGAHMLLAVDSGVFVSLLEPPDHAMALAATCQNRHTWPVLVGDRSRCDLMLVSPIVLYDFPAVAKESHGDLCDGAEIDEILSLRIITMTDEEKREARATDPRAKAILDRVEALTPEDFGGLHGTMRSFGLKAEATGAEATGAEATGAEVICVDGRRLAKGSRVRLRPNRRADAMDMFLKDQSATVAGVYRDLEDRVYVAVTVDADPAASLHESFGRYFYFDPAEVEVLDLMDASQEQV